MIKAQDMSSEFRAGGLSPHAAVWQSMRWQERQLSSRLCSREGQRVSVSFHHLGIPPGLEVGKSA